MPRTFGDLQLRGFVELSQSNVRGRNVSSLHVFVVGSIITVMIASITAMVISRALVFD